jgi:uncharacterized protein
VRDRIVAEVLGVYANAERIVLFGSRANGTDNAESDYDLLVVVDTVLSPARRAAPLHLALRDLNCVFDILVVTPAEFDRNSSWKSSVVYAAMAEGEPLYEAA